MSEITFHTTSGEVKVHGSERVRGLQLAVAATQQALGLVNDARVDQLVRTGVLPPAAIDYSIAIGIPPLDSVEMWLRDVLGVEVVSIEGEQGPVAHAVLNTAIKEGPDALALLARLHGSVEDRLWIDAEDHTWFAEVVASGLSSSVLTPGAGWEGLIEHLTATVGPIVVSSSQGREFPDVTYDEHDEPIGIDPGQAWRDSLTRLRDEGWWLRLSPENIRTPAYTPCKAFPSSTAVVKHQH